MDCAHAPLDTSASRLALLLSIRGLRCAACGASIVLESPVRAVVRGGSFGAVALATAAAALGWSDVGGALVGTAGVLTATQGWPAVLRAGLVPAA